MFRKHASRVARRQEIHALFLAVIIIIIHACQPAFASPRGAVRPDEANGSIGVYAFAPPGWSKIGTLYYSQLSTEQALSLAGLVPQEGPLTLRLVKEGGGAAHLDCVLLDRVSPVSAGDNSLFTMEKLRNSDHDVVELLPEGIEVQFESGGPNRVLSVTARIEGNTISPFPFRFPMRNNSEEVGSDGEFLTYRLGSQQGTLCPDGDLSEVEGRPPFLTEFVKPASGHPDGLVYIWVMNDSENLYVSMDFTSDNTSDGDSDYASVFYRGADGLKEFRVSLNETRWGSRHHVYTDKVAYQHNVYEFAIPLAELDVESTGPARSCLWPFPPTGQQRRRPL